jgi:hypothetical protein
MLAAVVAVATALIVGASPPAPVLQLPRPIGGIAVVGGKLSYLDSKDCSVKGAVEVARLSASMCQYHSLQVAGARALAAGYVEVKCSDDTWIVTTGPPVKRLESRSPNCYSGGSELTGTASTGAALYYSYVDFDEANDCHNAGGKCAYILRGGGVYRASGGQGRAVGGIPPAMLLDAAPGRIAIVAAPKRHSASATATPLGTAPFPATGAVVVYDDSGKELQRFALPAQAEALAVSPTGVAAVTIAGKQRTLRWFGDHHGTLALGTTDVIGLKTDRNAAVVETAKQVLAVDLASGTKTVLGSIEGEAGALALDGGAAYWVDNTARRGRVLKASLSH